MANGNRNCLSLMMKSHFGLARRGWNNFDSPEGQGGIGQLQAGSDSELRSPSPQTPVAAPLGKAKAAEAVGPVLTQPIVSCRDISSGLWEPIHVHHETKAGGATCMVFARFADFSVFGWPKCDSFSLAMPFSTASMRLGRRSAGGRM